MITVYWLGLLVTGYCLGLGLGLGIRFRVSVSLGLVSGLGLGLGLHLVLCFMITGYFLELLVSG